MNKQNTIMVAEHAIIAEVHRNYQEIQEFSETVTERNDKLKAIDDLDGTTGFFRYVNRFEGFYVAQLDDSAWRRTGFSQLTSEMNPVLIENAFEIYDMNQFLDDLNARVIDMMLSENMYDPQMAQQQYMVVRSFFHLQMSLASKMLPVYKAFTDTYPLDEEVP